MAAIFIVAGLAIADKIEKKKQKKQAKRDRDEARFRELQVETSRRLSRTQSGNVIEHTYDSGREEDADDSELLHSVTNEESPPRYEDAVSAGERREHAWRAEMTRRRSSAYSNQGGRER